jgi:hypothetical protein
MSYWLPGILSGSNLYHILTTRLYSMANDPYNKRPLLSHTAFTAWSIKSTMHSEVSTASVYIRHVWKVMKLVVLFYIWGNLTLCHSSYFEATAFKRYAFLWCSTHFSGMWQLLVTSDKVACLSCYLTFNNRKYSITESKEWNLGCTLYRFPTDICLHWHYHLCSMYLCIILKQIPLCHEELGSFIPKLHSAKHLFSAFA